MSKSFAGSVDIYAETGLDQWTVLTNRIKREIERKQIKEGQTYYIPLGFSSEGLVAVVEIRNLEDAASDKEI